ncbi:putative RNA-directed DNA polymerase [Helianthus annuus]|nr:putative RNA-directed DNA polymerase [Helianthus annuus]
MVSEPSFSDHQFPFPLLGILFILFFLSIPSSSMENKNHPALMVTNIRNFVPFTLEMESGQYNSWSELFKIHCKAFLVFDHIDPTAVPPTVSTPQSAPSSDKAAETTTKTVTQEDVALWHRLDAIVIQWIYSTISNDLLHTIIKANATALEAWTSLEDIFQDNKNERALYLEHKLVTTRLENYPSMSAYCQAIKMLADQLSNVGAPLTNQRIVLQLIGGLTNAYDGIAMIIQQIKPLPGFYEVRSRLCMEESRKANQAIHEAATSNTALNVQHQRTTGDNRTHSQRGRGGRSYRGRGGRHGGRGRSNNISYGRGYSSAPNYTTQPWTPNYNTSSPNSQWSNSQQYSPTAQYPPCPYPTSPHQPSNQRPAQHGQHNPNGPQHGLGILGPRPQAHHAYASSELSYAPTDIEQALHAMSLHPPEQQGIFDTGATSHMTNNSGI